MRSVVHEFFDKFDTLMVWEATFVSPSMRFTIEVLKIVSEVITGKQTGVSVHERVPSL